MRSALFAIAIVLSVVPACQRKLARYGEILLVVDTDAPAPALASHFRLDLYSADGTHWIDSRDIAVLDQRDWPVSLSLYDPSSTVSKTALVRVRIFPDGKVRDYRGERFATPPEDGKPSFIPPEPPGPNDQGPRLFDAAGIDVTPATEPLPLLTMDRLLLVDLAPGALRSVRVVLHGDCFGTMANMSTLESCIDAAGARAPAVHAPLDPNVAPPTKSLQGTFGGGARCTVPTRAPRDGFFEDEVCIDGGAFIFGNGDIAGFDDADGLVVAGVPERVVHLQPMRMDRYEVTVARWRDAVLHGFAPPDGSPRENNGPLDREADERDPHLCTWSAMPDQNRENYPLTCVTWNAARAFCQFIGGDLPTEAQWEYVAQAYGRSVKTRFPWGDADPQCNTAVFGRLKDIRFGENRCLQPNFVLEGPVPVDTSSDTDLSIAAGIVGMGGGVTELVADALLSMKSVCWLRAPLESPICEDPDTIIRSGRGGDWAQNTLNMLSGVRTSIGSATDERTVTGLRCVRGGVE